MDLFKPFRVCFCCQMKRGLHRVHDDTIYGSHWYYYHRHCLMDVLAHPEEHSRNVVDIAIAIDTFIQREEDTRSADLENRRRQLDNARQRFDRRRRTEQLRNPTYSVLRDHVVNFPGTEPSFDGLRGNNGNAAVTVSAMIDTSFFKPEPQKSIPEKPEPEKGPPNSRYDLLKRPVWPVGRIIKEADEWKEP